MGGAVSIDVVIMRRAVLAALAVLAIAAPAAGAASTTLVSQVGTGGAVADDAVSALAVSGDGRYVAFASTATNLGGPTNGRSAVYVKDTQTGALTLVSKASDAGGGAVADTAADEPSISADGRYVCFASAATNLGAGSSGEHVYVRDVQNGTTVAVDRIGTGTPLGGFDPVISGDGSTVLFRGSEDSYSGGSSGNYQTYAHDLSTGATTLVSRASGAIGSPADTGGGTTGFGGEPGIAVSPNARYVAFVSDATNLTSDTHAGTVEVYLRDRTDQTTTLISRAGTTGAEADARSYAPSVADNGTVAFFSEAANLGVPQTYAVWVRPLGGPTALASRSAGLDGTPQSGSDPSLSADGTVLAWLSQDNLADPMPPDVFTQGEVQRRRLADGQQDVVDVSSLGDDGGYAASDIPVVSADGEHVAFSSRVPLVSGAGSLGQAFARDETRAAPQAITAPVVAWAGGALACASGDWTGMPTRVTRRWLRDGTPIPGATGAGYVPADADAGHAIRCEVTATNGLDGVASSAPLTVGAPPVAGGTFEFLGEFGSDGTGPGHFSTNLDGLAVAPDGNLLVADRGVFSTGSIGMYAPDGTFIRGLGDVTQRQYPVAAGAGEHGQLVVLAGAEHAAFTQDGYVLGHDDCGFSKLNPWSSIAVDAGGNVFVGGSIGGVPGVVACDAAGNELRSWTVAPSSGAASPYVAVGPDGNVYVAVGYTVEVYDETGTLLRTFPGLDATAHGIAVGPDGHVWVATFGSQVIEYAADGLRLTAFGSTGSVAGQFFTPGPLAIEPDGSIAVADPYNHRIERFREITQPGGGGNGNPGGGGGGGGGAPLGGGNVVNVDVTAPALDLLGGLSAAQLRAGGPAATVRCDERCTVTVTGTLAVVRRTVRTGTAARATMKRRARAARKKKAKPKLRPLPRLGPYRRPHAVVTSAVLADGDLGPSTATLDAGAATPVVIAIAADQRAAIIAAAQHATSALLSLDITATDTAGNRTEKTVDLRVALR